MKPGSSHASLPRLLTFAALLLIASTVPSRADETVVLLSKENRIYRLIADGLFERLGQGPSIVRLTPGSTESQLKDRSPGVVVAVGDEAAAWALENWTATPVVLSGVIDSLHTGARGRVRGVRLDVPVTEQVERLRKYLPSAKIVGMLLGTAYGEAVRREIEAAGPRAGLTVWTETVSQNRDLTRAIDQMAGKIDAFVVVFDPAVLRPEAFQYLIQFSITHRVPLVVPSYALLKPGAVLSFEASYEGVGRQTADVVRAVRQGRAPAGLAAPEKTVVGFNRKAARALHLAEPAAADVDRFHE